MNKKTFLPYGRQSISDDDVQFVADALRSDWITRGSKVQEFEEAVAEYCGARYAVAFSSGTSALHAAAHAAKISPYDRVMTTPNTFVASIGPSILKGATPVFVDIDRDTGNLSLEQLKYTLEVPFTRGQQVVIPVHFGGIAVDMETLSKALVHPDSLVIEDAAHALGSSYPDGSKVGCCAYSAMTVFSFHPVKAITTGEGGMVTTNDFECYQALKQYRNNGIVKPENYPQPWYYEVEELTGNHHLTDFQAALGLSQLGRLDAFAEKRRVLVKRYRQQLKGLPYLSLFTDCADEDTCFHLMVVQIDFEALGKTREGLVEALEQKGIGTQVHYIPIYRHPFFKKKIKDVSAYFPNMEAYYSRALSLPLFAEMEESDVDCVVSEIQRYLC
ncbi:uncharacterized protein MJ1066 [Waddlia chondrophila 2032/99]|uniref:UDP-4-amino-4-deoxy-L-arabinose--oxoglutarateaminotransferase n=2 Tax=Waddlia chondrophila TaxID=71667 RepID=D6YUA9_WADCW|nr:UDP-4-amino-4,6-dideoxy-N-acetyl-beta-L-altrosamine transaminase [Waddlia chondrophila]ADI37720.1 UDP-4-amino-4-deoxy-L-arabinose--oxoglutarateaminotransferase [Waddlia chondrophila WSU 86-1044]CCB90936.1 uncharacterized protein MJ1066 [Waddlia chondrophila 2032/99]